MLDVGFELANSPGRDLPEQEFLAGPDSFLENLREPFVHPDRQIVADGEICELMKRFMLKRAPERVAALAIEKGGEIAAIRLDHKHAARVHDTMFGEGHVILFTGEEISGQRWRVGGWPEILQAFFVFFLHHIHAMSELRGEGGIEIGVNLVMLGMDDAKVGGLGRHGKW